MLKAVLYIYDIPRGKGFNPSWKLRRIAIRANLSCWVVPETRLPELRRIDEKLRAAGADTKMVRFDEDEFDVIIAMAQEAISKDFQTVHELLTTGLTRLRALFEDVTYQDHAAYRFAHGTAYRMLGKSKKLADAAEECLLGFGLLGDFTEGLNGLRNLIAARGEFFATLDAEARRRYSGLSALPLTTEVAGDTQCA